MNLKFPFEQLSQELTENPLARRIADFKNRGVPFIDLTLSNPTSVGFHYLENSLLTPFQHPENLHYQPNPRGLLHAREAISKYYARRGAAVHPDQIILTSGTSEAYALVFKILLHPGDSVAAPQPSYPLLDYLAQSQDVPLLRWDLNLANQDWRIKAALPSTANVKALLGVHPNNPTGNYLIKSHLEMLSQSLSNRCLPWIIDEVFLDFSLQESNRIETFANHQERLTFTLSGISKVLGLPQMKLSWIVVSGPEPQKKKALQALEALSDIYLSVGTPVQQALPSLMEKEEEIQEEIKMRIRGNWKTLAHQAAKHPEIHLPISEGGWCAPLRLDASKNDEQWSLHLLENKKVLTHPGYLYDFQDDGWIVLSLLPEPEIFEEGLRRIFGD